MKKIELEKLEPGMQLSRPVTSADGRNVLLEAGLLLNRDYIERLERWNLECVYIVDTSSQDERNEEHEKLLTEEFTATHDRAVSFTRGLVSNVMKGKSLDVPPVETPVIELLDKLLIDKNVLFKLTGIHTADNYLYAHSVNTAVLSLLVAMHLNIEGEELVDLGTAALLADVGMSLIPQDVFDHSKPLSEDDRRIIRKHPEFSIEILSKITSIKQTVIDAVYQHHERYDGGGYPQGISGDDICMAARIIAVADAYAAVREPRSYRVHSGPRTALRTLSSDHGLDPAVLRALFGTISVYPVDSVVRLSNGCLAVVAKAAENNPFRPVVKIFKDDLGRDIYPPNWVDLSSPAFLALYIEEELPPTT